MKIGIFTLPLHFNYGGIMQAYALQTVLRSMGHDVFLLRKNPLRRIKKFPLNIFSRVKNWAVCKIHHKAYCSNERYNKEYYMVGKYTLPFIEKYIKCFRFEKYSELMNSQFDAYVVGSDQVWRPPYIDDISQAYLAFAEHSTVKRLSYAASFGTSEWEYSLEEETRCKELIKKFDLITVRETSGIDLCKKHFGVEPQLVLDPTLLLDKKDYETNFGLTPSGRNFLMTYVLDESDFTRSMINQLAEELRLPIHCSNSKAESITAPVEDRVQPPVECWLQDFEDASFVITDSFHACAFSIVFNRPFVVVINKDRGAARFESLLKTFGLESRICNSLSSLEMIIGEKINWDVVNDIKYKKAKQSISILTNCIN